MSLSFVLVDVFTRRPLAGNPLAVVLDADGVPEATLKAIAREFGHSETTFVLKPRKAEAAWRLRCFTSTGDEVFGAGHNALGAWWVLAAKRRLTLAGPRDVLRQELGDRVSPVEVRSVGGRPAAVFMQQAEPAFGPVLADRAALAAALGLEARDLDNARPEPQAVSTGAWHLMVPVRDREILGRVKVQAERLVAVARTVGCHGCYLFALDPIEAGSAAHARAFNPGIGIAEDPATGSAAGPLVAYLVAKGVLSDGVETVIEQGDFLDRPSRIQVHVDGVRVEVGGQCIIVGEGTLNV